MSKTKVAFLYSEIAGYFMASAKALSKDADVLIVKWPTNSEAPFKFEDENNIQILEKSEHSQENLLKKVKAFEPDILVCSGWMDKDYLKIVKKMKGNCKMVLSLDNHWVGSLKQKIAALVSPFLLKKHFDYAWVPGSKQEQYAKKLGFGNKILKGFYCADTELFNKKFEATFENKRKKLPKRFLFVARYVKHKGIFEMWEAFSQLQKEMPNEWELWCLGTGDEWDNKIDHAKIKHFGFVQPADMDHYIAETGVYILPSIFEPWGVTVQEFAIAGFPLLLSTAIGSEEQFLKNNGYHFEPGNVGAIKAALKQVIEMNEADLIQQAETSNKIGLSYTNKEWAQRIVSIKEN